MSDNNQAVTPDNTIGVAPGWYPDSQHPGHMRWWDGHAWTNNWQPMQATNIVQPVAVINPVPQKINHVLHLLLSVLTFGLWIPVWIILAIVHASKK